MRPASTRRRAFVTMLPAALAVLYGCGSVTPGPDEAQRPPDGPPAPDFTGGGAWINTAPLTLEELRGRVVLVDFWTYGCYNCQNTLPAMRDWWATYKDRGLVIVGVHTPEFEHERDLENVRITRCGSGAPTGITTGRTSTWSITAAGSSMTGSARAHMTSPSAGSPMPWPPDRPPNASVKHAV
jgi:thiol-disulfide isomerase/thioredoxin